MHRRALVQKCWGPQLCNAAEKAKEADVMTFVSPIWMTRLCFLSALRMGRYWSWLQTAASAILLFTLPSSWAFLHIFQSVSDLRLRAALLFEPRGVSWRLACLSRCVTQHYRRKQKYSYVCSLYHLTAAPQFHAHIHIRCRWQMAIMKGDKWGLLPRGSSECRIILLRCPRYPPALLHSRQSMSYYDPHLQSKANTAGWRSSKSKKRSCKVALELFLRSLYQVPKSHAPGTFCLLCIHSCSVKCAWHPSCKSECTWRATKRGLSEERADPKSLARQCSWYPVCPV